MDMTEYIKFSIVTSGSELSAAIVFLITFAKNTVWNCAYGVFAILIEAV